MYEHSAHTQGYVGDCRWCKENQLYPGSPHWGRAQIMTEGKITERVLAGMKFLDSCYGGWKERIDLGKLDLASDTDCILGQLFGNYVYAEDALGITLEQSISYGFAIEWDALYKGVNEYPALTDEWTAQITYVLAGEPAL